MIDSVSKVAAFSSVYILIGCTVGLSVLQVLWWNQPDRKYHKTLVSNRIEKQPTKFPVEALETLCRDGVPDIQASARELLKNFFLASPETIGILRDQLSSVNVDDRLSGITVVRGLTLNGDLESYDKVCDDETVKCLMLGLFESLDSQVIATCRAILHRKETIRFIGSVINESFDEVYLFIKHGLVDYLLEYENATQPSGHAASKLPTLEGLCDNNSPHFYHFYSVTLQIVIHANELCGLGVIDWCSPLSEIWNRFRADSRADSHQSLPRCPHTAQRGESLNAVAIDYLLTLQGMDSGDSMSDLSES
jgi:hypothetical protein